MTPAEAREKLEAFATIKRPPTMHFSQLTVMWQFIYIDCRARLIRQAKAAGLRPKVISHALGMSPSAAYRMKQ